MRPCRSFKRAVTLPLLPPSLFVDALSVSIGIAGGAWEGVDLRNVRASRRVGKLLVANLSLAQKWLHDQGPSQLGVSAGAISEAMGFLNGETTPFVECEDIVFDPHGSLVTWSRHEHHGHRNEFHSHMVRSSVGAS